ncbi:Formimidoyltransferase-cyclodeaminase [Fukomys damarensis]|uniref:Formimidoyltransferase-cyclodeaminase n=1 Tax=Fukomys damarensis TaxID=885580 RepID=A0A091DZ19_FUKDA|nr:Formimidoyltransferase-cyclodeaminase [Fukomys damarensis]
MSQLVECVPNFSEGNNKEVIDAISGAIAQTPGCVLLDVDAGPSTNRTVYTFVGQPECVVSGALNAARAAWGLINMSQHRGEHPRMGALDVCPFIPVRGVSMEDCVLCAQAFGQRLAEELSVPVYLYGEAAQMASRRSLPAIRAGEYEALPEKLKRAEWAPDFGPSTFVPSWGATVTGARKFLIAFNVNLLGTKEQAHRIALNLREQGRGKDQASGWGIVSRPQDTTGAEHGPGRLKKVQGIGWYLEEKKLAQVSTNLLDFEVTALHTVYEETCREAQELSLPVVGSQLVGLVPLQALLDAAAFYCHRENLFVLEEEHRIRLVVSRLGLDSLAPFNPKERVVEYLVPDDPEQRLLDLSLRDFVREVGARSAAPGGGSVAAAAGAMGAALACMAGQMTYGRRRFEHLDGAMRRLIPPFHKAAAQLASLVDADAQAFTACLEVIKLPRNTPEEGNRHAAALQERLRQAVEVPLALAETVSPLWPVLQELALCGNLACLSDLQGHTIRRVFTRKMPTSKVWSWGLKLLLDALTRPLLGPWGADPRGRARVAAKALEMSVFGAYFNVLTNLRDMVDEAFKEQIHQRISSLLQEAKTQAMQVLNSLEARRECWPAGPSCPVRPLSPLQMGAPHIACSLGAQGVDGGQVGLGAGPAYFPQSPVVPNKV